jgi:hypothetical protein
MGVTTRILNEPKAQEVAKANLANLEVAKGLLAFVEVVDPKFKEQIYDAIGRIVKNTSTIAEALNNAPTGRS